MPKFLVDDDGSLGERNAVECVSIEHKMGIHASPTCVMAYDGAVGYLIGEANDGMRYMFTMMNNARLSVGCRACRSPSGPTRRRSPTPRSGARAGRRARRQGETSPIVDHPDVRRMLLTMRAQIEAMRGLAYINAESIDLAARHPDEAERTGAGELADLLTPITKGWCTDLGVELTSLGIQVHGGMGYIEETGVAQHYRDIRIAPIYEGTNGIQAMDLVGRKLPMRAGGVVADFLAGIEATAGELSGADGDAGRRSASTWPTPSPR